jgi:hypothetical protein
MGIDVFLATLDFSHSLLKTKIEIAMMEIIVTAGFKSGIFVKISRHC